LLTVEALEDRTLLSPLVPITVFNPNLPPSDSTGGAERPLTSADGRFTVYQSTAANVVPQQVNTAVASNIFLYDQQAGTTTLVSHTAGSFTTGGDGDCFDPRISSDGRYVVYESTADNLVSGQTGPHGQGNIFLYNTATGSNTLISHRSGSPTTAANAGSQTFYTTGFGFGPYADRFFLFSSNATDLVTDQKGQGSFNLFLYDTDMKTTTLVSHNASSALTGANDATEFADLAPAPDGSSVSVVFQSFATDVVAGQTGNKDNIFLYNTATGTSQLVSGTFTGSGNSPTAGAGNSFQPLISTDGRIISYASCASGLVAGQPSSGNCSTDNVYYYNTANGTTILVSAANGLPSMGGNGNSTTAVVSSDGSTIAFLSAATNLTPGQGNNADNAFLYKTSTGALTLVSHVNSSTVTAAGGVGLGGINDNTFDALSLSADGRLACYESTADDLVAGQQGPSGTANVFVYDRQSGRNMLVSQVNGSPTAPGDRNSYQARLSLDGSTVVFLSLATNLDPGLAIADGGSNLFLFDVTTGAGPALVSRSAFRAAPTNTVAGTSADGRFVVFTSNDPNVLPDQVDHNGDQDVFLFERDTGTITLVSHTPGSPTTTGNLGSPDTLVGEGSGRNVVISGDGNWVAFVSQATNLVAGESGGGTDVNQVFLFNRRTGVVTLVSHDSASPATAGSLASDDPILSADGSFLAYESFAPDLVQGFVPPSGEDVSNVYLYDTATGTNTLVSHAASSPLASGDNGSYGPVIGGDGSGDGSDDGRFVAYTSQATTLVSGGTGSPTANVYLFDRFTGANTLVSHAAGSSRTGDNGSFSPVLSADGSTVAFVSFATDLVPGQLTTPYTNVFLYQVATGLVSLVSGVNGSPTDPATGYSDSPVLNQDGSRLAFRSDATDLVAHQLNTGTSNVFLFDRPTGAVILLSHADGQRTTTAAGNSTDPDIDAAGDLVVYLSTATNLVPGQQNTLVPVNNVFLYSVPLGVNGLCSGQGGSTAVTSDSPAAQAIISRDPIVAFTILSRGGAPSVAFINKLVELVLSSSTVADGSPAGTVVGTLSVNSVLAGQYLAPLYRLLGGEADNAAFALGAGTGGTAPLLIEVLASYATQPGYQVSIHVNIGLGDEVAVFAIAVTSGSGPPPPRAATLSYLLVFKKMGRRKKTRKLVVQLFDAATGVEKREIVSPFQRPAFRNIQVSIGEGPGGTDAVMITARRRRKTVTATYLV
jgi:hypothetical protein